MNRLSSFGPVSECELDCAPKSLMRAASPEDADGLKSSRRVQRSGRGDRGGCFCGNLQDSCNGLRRAARCSRRKSQVPDSLNLKLLPAKSSGPLSALLPMTPFPALPIRQLPELLQTLHLPSQPGRLSQQNHQVCSMNHPGRNVRRIKIVHLGSSINDSTA